MEIDDKYKHTINLLNNSELFNEDHLKIMLESCCCTLTGRTVSKDFCSSLDEHSTQKKETYSSLLYIFTEFVRNNQSTEDFVQFLKKECDLNSNVIKIIEDFYIKWRIHIRIQLLNIGNELPHVTDVMWKIDNIIDSNSSNNSEGPVFRISLKLEKFDRKSEGPSIEFLEFSCSTPELQDFVYKLNDSVRHCQKFTSDQQ
ncbi:COMM domain-containing protein 3 [Rhynchophorus ferrugineus]|uniref:COMM domain-containing protein 3 n=1 Tax=Rhynchophorus ferrugineus TaxID=354439 RepID=A0A834MH00_RHYFE|nr:hypothetical protein GWI33_023269 [Rhynchophorus ferrugineus]